MKRVLVTGPEQSGTGVVATVLREAGADVLHRAVPHVHDWWAWEIGEQEISRAVVVVRGLYAHTESVKERSGEYRAKLPHWTPLLHRARALEILAQLPHVWTPVWVTYESLGEPAEVAYLCESLGLDASRITTRIENRNHARYRREAA